MAKAHFDFGHGGKDPGAIGNNLKEKDLNLSIGLKTAAIVERHGVEISYSRTTDVFIDLTPRANMANNAKADIFVSFHINSATNPNARGFEIWTTVGQTKADHLADIIGNCLIEDFPNVPFRKDMSDGDLDKEKNFTVIYKSKMPAVLLELGFIVNSQDANMLRTDQDKIAKSIARGILKYFGIEYRNDSIVRLNILGKDISANGYVKNNTNYIKIGNYDIPVRELGKAFNLSVDWDNKNKVVVMK